MSHLSIERLAALADEQPTADEQAHLAQCAECTTEFNAHRSLLAMAGGERDAMQLPLTRWETLSQQLRKEGLIADSRNARAGSPRPSALTRRSSARAMLQVAAALLLVAGGAALGRFSAGASAIPGGFTGAATQSASGKASTDSLPTSFASLEEANRWKTAYANAYQRTVTFLAANDSSAASAETPAVMRARLSALSQVNRTMREALNDAPFDPVINDFYLNSFGQREATLRQLNTVLPQGVRMTGF
ncbi:MAG TPA: hypothetical protein VIF32_08275 [Gemmatimonadaceae bacterium]|jgi:hypothetical protein